MKRLRALFTRKPAQVFNITITNPVSNETPEVIRQRIERIRKSGGPWGTA